MVANVARVLGLDRLASGTVRDLEAGIVRGLQEEPNAVGLIGFQEDTTSAREVALFFDQASSRDASEVNVHTLVDSIGHTTPGAARAPLQFNALRPLITLDDWAALNVDQSIIRLEGDGSLSGEQLFKPPYKREFTRGHSLSDKAASAPFQEAADALAGMLNGGHSAVLTKQTVSEPEFRHTLPDPIKSILDRIS
ncbi:MAG: hypothetical protein KTR14_00565 [Vampirovibrio sp.]|nr:hypothetical protein [Vampirovibrio sp.]